MRLRDRVYALALRAYPAGFRESHQEEMLATLADMGEAGEARNHLRHVASLLFDGGRQRWLDSTGGSLAATVRQGLAWGVLVIVARQVGFAAIDVFRPLIRGFSDPDVLSHILLLIGWTAAFCLLASGLRRWGLAALGAVIVAFTAYRVDMALGYGGRFDLPWMLSFILPTVAPLLAACVWPARGVRLPAWSWAPALALAAVIPQVSLLGRLGQDALGSHAYFAVQVAVAVCAVVLLVVMAVSDPRWAIATCGVLSVFGARSLTRLGMDQAGLATLGTALALWVVIPAAAALFARRIRRAVDRS